MPISVNIYTNDQSILPTNTKAFAYADDLGITVKGRKLKDIDGKLGTTLNISYYKKNSLKPNPTKTEPTEMLTYGVVLERTLAYNRYHREETRKYVNARNFPIRKLTIRKWSAKLIGARASAQSLCFSIAEYVCPECPECLPTQKKVNITSNET